MSIDRWIPMFVSLFAAGLQDMMRLIFPPKQHFSF